MKHILCSVVFLLLISTQVIVLADSIAVPHSYSESTANGKFIFVMIAPIEVDRDGSYLGKDDQQEAQRIREKYTLSGMYLNDGSTTPLWTVNWYSHRVLVSSDGVHVVRTGPWTHSLSDEALTFFENGTVLRTYSVGDLVDTEMLLPHSFSHFTWSANELLNEQNRTFSVTTLSKEKYVYDLTTGRVVSARRPLRGTIAAVLSLFACVAVWMLRRRQIPLKSLL